MKGTNAHAITSFTVFAALTGMLISISCAGGPGTPTAPTGTVNLSPRSQSPASGQEAHSSTGAQHTLLLTKTCDALDHCTVITSPSGPIPAGSDVNYFGPQLELRTASSIVVTTPGGDTATGHCSVGYKTGEGTCVLTGGTGALAGLHANLKVTSDFVADPNGVFTWEGRYHFVR
jgi:hypothetical protein